MAKKDLSRAMQAAASDMADVLMKYGFPPTEAMKESVRFWGNHRKKLREMM